MVIARVRTLRNGWVGLRQETGFRHGVIAAAEGTRAPVSQGRAPRYA
ncbi:MAG: hypothetical protein OJF48_004009 [Afipia sp.]|nr:MAG: hypothetical protein OJF48_004009 [Afipia sp.]